MVTIEVNGKNVHLKVSPYRARLSIPNYKTKMMVSFSKIGIDQNYIDVNFGGGNGTWSEDGWAEVIWFVNGKEYNYRCDSQPRAVDNVASIAQMIEQDSKAIRRGMKTFGQVMNQFRLGFDGDVEKLKSPRDIIGVESMCKDLAYIEFKYKQLAKKYHTDNKETGNPEKIRKINEAYEKLREELGGGSDEMP